MVRFNVLYQIKTLESLITKNFMKNLKGENFSKKVTTQSQMRLLEYILNSKNEVYQKDLENIFSFSRATISGILHTMEKNGLILRKTSSLDNKSKKIVLNPKARKVFEKNKKHLNVLQESLVKGISDEELESFCSTIEKMKYNLRNL